MSNFKTVPVDATDEMIISAMRNVQVEDGGGFRGIGWIEAVQCYRAMIAAAPIFSLDTAGQEIEQ